MAEAQLSEALSWLHKTESNGGVSVFDHLSQVLSKVLEERPKDGVDIFEASLNVSKTRNQPQLTEPLLPLPADPAVRVKTEDARALFRNAEPKINPENGEPIELEPPNEYEGEDVVDQAALLEAVGAGLARSEMYAVAMAGKKLGEDPSIKVATVRFFGKFLGTHGDYYVFETTLKEPAEAPEETPAEGEAPSEAPGSGSNTYSYYVCSYLGGPFHALPNVTPKQIKVARQIKKFLTGNLQAPVSAYPPFPGDEASYLRAQIARIAATTVLCPAGFYNVGEDEVSVEKNEEFAAQDAGAMLEAASWAHRNAHLKKQGRCVVFKPEPPEGEEEAPEPTEEESEEGPALLTGADQDVEVEGGPAWTPVVSSAVNGTKYQVSGVRSNLWPGAYAVAKGASFVNVYVGHGVKNAPFVPLPPPAVAKEFDMKEMESSDLPPKPAPPAEGEEGEAEE